MTPHRLALALAGALASLPALAAPITTSAVFHFIESRTAGAFGAATVLEAIGADAVPNGQVTGGTTATASLASMPGRSFNVPYVGGTANPNQFFRAFTCRESPTLNCNPGVDRPPGEAFTITFTNEADSRTVTTPRLDGAYVMPFARDVALLGSTFTPTVRWTLPTGAGLDVDAVRINLWDKGSVNLAGNAPDLVYSTTLRGQVTEFTVPQQLAGGLSLQAGHAYVMEVGLLDLRSDGGSLGNANVLTRSRKYVEFTPLPGGSIDPVHLPVVTQGVNGGPSLFTFDISGVNGERFTFIDPEVAVGYDYRIGEGDPLFAAVMLPLGIGDDLYRIVLPDGSEHLARGGEAFEFSAFDPDGVEHFRVLGIETGAGLSPNDPLAFVTGLRFAGSGSFTGTMQAIVANVPTPGTAWLVAPLLAGLGLGRRRRA